MQRKCPSCSRQGGVHQRLLAIAHFEGGAKGTQVGSLQKLEKAGFCTRASKRSSLQTSCQPSDWWGFWSTRLKVYKFIVPKPTGPW